jgi:hypothetical protein
VFACGSILETRHACSVLIRNYLENDHLEDREGDGKIMLKINIVDCEDGR